MTKSLVATLFTVIIMLGCNTKKTSELKEGIWQAKLQVKEGNELPFNFKLEVKEKEAYRIAILNGEEVINVDEIVVAGDSITIQMPVFEGYIKGTYTSDAIHGDFIIGSLDRIVPFEAKHGVDERFSNPSQGKVNISGIWETEFSPNAESNYFAKGIFTQKDNKVLGTFRTNTGDYRYLEGVMDGDSLKLSAFDGSHAFLFLAKASDSTLSGTFYSGNHFKEPFAAVRNEAFELPSSDSLTFLKEGFDKLSFSFPDTSFKMVSLNDEQYDNKVVIVQIMGSWCPNCLDETKFLVDYLKKHKTENLEIIGLAFEYAKTEELAMRSIERLVDRAGVNYPVLLAQYGTYNKKKAQEKLPMLNHVLSYPTTIFMGKDGKVRRIHTGFNGPATGDKYVAFTEEFDHFVKTLLSE